MRCVCPISGGNWNNSSITGVWALNLNNARGNSNDNYGFRSDPLPAKKPGAALADRQRGGLRRAWWRNVSRLTPLVAANHHAVVHAKTEAGAPA